MSEILANISKLVGFSNNVFLGAAALYLFRNLFDSDNATNAERKTLRHLQMSFLGVTMVYFRQTDS